MWARNQQHGLLSLVLEYTPDDSEGGWVEPFVGLHDQRVETLLLTHANLKFTQQAMRQTLLVGSTKWQEPRLKRQPAHTHAESLAVVNAVLRWWDAAMPLFEQRFGKRLGALDALFNQPHPLAHQYLRHELHWALRGIAIRHVLNPAGMTEAMDFHRSRMLESGYWEVYGEQVRAFVMILL